MYGGREGKGRARNLFPRQNTVNQQKSQLGVPFLIVTNNSKLIQVCFAVVSSDVDECSSSTPVCDVTATCENTIGSYRCSCTKAGFTADGKGCIGK